MKKSFKLIAKLLISIAALFLVFRKIDIGEIGGLIGQSEVIWLIIACLAFAGSKLVSAMRLWGLFNNMNLKISQTFNLKLYLLGMFYNTLLPGGIGGDGYKVWLLSKREHFAHIGRKVIIQTIFYDRLIGLWILSLIITCFSIFIFSGYWFLGIIIFQIAGFTFLRNKYFGKFEYLKPALQSFAVQALQIISVFFIIRAIGVEAQEMKLVTIFLISSVASAIPVSVGGVGVRELVFLYLSDMLNLLPEVGVSIALLFFCITFFVSFFGIYYSFYPPEETLVRNFSINHKQP